MPDCKPTVRDLRTASALRSAVLLVFCLVIASLQFSPIVQAKQGGVGRSLDMTVVELIRGGRIASAAWFGLWAVLVDLVLFFPGHLLDIFHRGNMPYWDMGTLAVAWLGAPASVSASPASAPRSEEHTSELQSHVNLVCRLLLEKKKKSTTNSHRVSTST